MNKSNLLKLIVIIISIVGIYSCTTTKSTIINNDSEKVTLKWKVNDTIEYTTKMEQIGEAEFDMDFGKTFGKIFGDFSKKMDSTNVKKDSTKNDLNNLFRVSSKSLN